jgi:aspartyl protease family protein
MQKLILVLLFGSVYVGALMDAEPPASGPEAETRSSEEPILAVAPPLESPSQTLVEVGSGSVTLERAGDGHFYAEAQVNGMPVKFLVDTGASAIALSRRDAQRAAIPTDPTMDEVIGTGASGPVKGQFVKLERVRLGPAEARNMDAAVLAGGEQSLLGQSFLSQFQAVTIEGDTMVLR